MLVLQVASDPGKATTDVALDDLGDIRTFGDLRMRQIVQTPRVMTLRARSEVHEVRRR